MTHYITFAEGGPYGKVFVEIDTDDYNEAREAAFEAHKDRWAFIYDEKGWAGQVRRYNYKRLSYLHKTEFGWRARVGPHPMTPFCNTPEECKFRSTCYKDHACND